MVKRNQSFIILFGLEDELMFLVEVHVVYVSIIKINSYDWPRGVLPPLLVFVLLDQLVRVDLFYCFLLPFLQLGLVLSCPQTLRQLIGLPDFISGDGVGIKFNLVTLSDHLFSKEDWEVDNSFLCFFISWDSMLFEHLIDDLQISLHEMNQ